MTDDMIQNMTMEEAYEQLDQLLADMESGNHSLEETFSMYTKGLELVKICHDKIDAIEKKLLILEEEPADKNYF